MDESEARVKEKLRVYLRLGRVSNVPTVWSNTIAGVVLGGARPSVRAVVLLAIAMTLFYVGGMFLNDAFDREIDARERPERPIPSGQVSAREVFTVGYALLAAGGALAIFAGGLRAALPAAALAGAIVLYDAWHKGNALSPVLMGACRMLVYVTVAHATSAHVGLAVYEGGAVLLCWILGLSYVAKQENLSEVKNLWPLGFLAAPFVWASPIDDGFVAFFFLVLMAWAVRCVTLVRERKPGSIPKAVVGLIAGVSLVDALAIANAAPARAPLAFVAAAGFPLTLGLQRYVKGT
jgi:4-hydroxybenzoate polyprenyltransferase